MSGVTTATQFVYDLLDRPVEQTDALAQTVQYGYDPLGRLTGLTYPGGRALTNRYDALGRLTSQTDWAGRQMTYAYDRADRLIRRTWPNGVSQTNTFDDAGRLTSLTHSTLDARPSAINVALAYAYDRNGNKTGASEKGTLQWSQTSYTDDLADYTPAGRLKTRTVSITATNAVPSLGGEGQGEGGRISYHYDPSGNLTNAVKMLGATNLGSWTLTYDEDNRTTSIRFTTRTNSTFIQNRYDALGRRLSKTVDGVTTGCVLSLAGGMERILCDVDNNGNVTACYVHGPDLAYRVDAANNLVCYHADAMANIIALTGANGTNLAQYAYSPYGRVLASSNTAPGSMLPAHQPYTFVGSQGVMEELPGLYFMRARYYSADAGVFLSTDPVKKIGPSWKPTAYVYGQDNPYGYTDPDGNIAQFLIGAAVGMAKGFAVEMVNQTANWISGAAFDFDEVVTSTAAEGLDGLFSGFNPAVGGAVSKVYRQYIEALSRGESYSLKQGVADAVSGAATSFVTDQAFKSFVPKVSLSGGNYSGAVRGPEPSTLTGAFTGSHFVNNTVVRGTYETAQKVTGTVLGNSSVSGRTASVAAPYCSSVTSATSTKASGNSAGSGSTSGSGGSQPLNSSGGVGTVTYGPQQPAMPPATSTSSTSIWSNVQGALSKAWGWLRGK